MIETSVKQITQWLIANAPRIAELSLNPPATEEELSMLENTIGKTLPTDFRELYSTWNGMSDEENWGNFFFGMSFYTIDEIIADYEFRKSQSGKAGIIPLKKTDPEIDPFDFYNPAWIGIGTDGARSSLRLDLAPSDKGRYGQIIFIDGTYDIAAIVASSSIDLLRQFGGDLDKGLYSLEQDALEEGQHFLEPDQSIDLINWYHTERWKHLESN